MLRVSMSELSGWLADFAILFFLSLAAWRLWRQKLTSYARRLGLIRYRPTEAQETQAAREAMARLRELTGKPPDSRADDRRGYSRIWSTLLLAVIAASWALWGGMAFRDHQRIKGLETQLFRYQADTVIEHHVKILEQQNDGDFTYISDEEPQGGSFRPCAADQHNGVDTTGILTQAIGYIADYAVWEERGVCKSILRADCGFWFKDRNNNFKYARTDQ